MSDRVIYDKSTGEVILVIRASDEATADNQVMLNSRENSAVLIADVGGRSGFYVADGEIVDMPPRPHEDCCFDHATKTWVDNASSSVTLLPFRSSV